MIVARMIRGRRKIWHRDLFMNRETCPPFNADELDPGIRRTVQLLRDAGFETTDSGDGRSKGDAGEDYPHVHMVVPRSSALDEADRLLQCTHQWFIDPCMPTIQMTYSPLDGVCVLSLYSVCDADLY